MSRKGTPIDNSPMESFFGTMKSELLYNPLINIQNDREMIDNINEYINYYNNERIQKKLGYLTSSEFKSKCLKSIAILHILVRRIRYILISYELSFRKISDTSVQETLERLCREILLIGGRHPQVQF